MKMIIVKFKEEFAEYLDIKDSFCCIYGSQVYLKKNIKSDIDVFFAFKNPKTVNFKRLERKIVNFHALYGLKIDNEVAYSNKLLVSYSDIKEAVNLGCFKNKKGIFFVPKIKKTTKFLNSRAIRERLIFYTLTAPHIFLGRDHKNYDNFRQRAQKNLIILAKSLLGNNKCDKKSILDILFKSDSDEEGEAYLGYKRVGTIIKYLKQVIRVNNK